MIKLLQIFPPVLLATLLCACNLPKAGGSLPDTGIVATTVASTIQALTQLPGQSVPSTPSLLPTVQTTLSTPSLPPPSQTPLSTLTLPPPTQTLPPSLTPTITKTLLPSHTPIPKPGSIAGSISGYPYGSIPSLAIVAYGQNPPYNYSYMITGSGSYYSMSTDYLLPGSWQVVAYDSSGHAGGCPGLVTVISDQTVTCNISDWSGSYPSKPSGVPNP